MPWKLCWIIKGTLSTNSYEWTIVIEQLKRLSCACNRRGNSGFCKRPPLQQTGGDRMSAHPSEIPSFHEGRRPPRERVSRSDHPTINHETVSLIYLNSLTRSWIPCRSVYLGLHQFSPYMNSSVAWQNSSISQNLHGGGMTCAGTLTCSLTPGRDDSY